MKLFETLKNPVALVGQGFLAGAFLFFTVVSPSGGDVAPAAPAATGSVLSDLQV